jgi:hypothetical protein
VEDEGFTGFHESGSGGDGDDLAEHDIAEFDVEGGGEEAASGEDAKEARVGIDDVEVEDLFAEALDADEFEGLLDGQVVAEGGEILTGDGSDGAAQVFGVVGHGRRTVNARRAAPKAE